MLVAVESRRYLDHVDRRVDRGGLALDHLRLVGDVDVAGHSPEIRLVDHIVIYWEDPADALLDQLLSYVRTVAGDPDDRDARLAEFPVALRPNRKRLTIQPVTCCPPLSRCVLLLVRGVHGRPWCDHLNGDALRLAAPRVGAIIRASHRMERERD